MSQKPGSHSWLWLFRKDAVISELRKYRVAIEPKATLPELRFLLKTELNKTCTANAGRAERYDQLLIDLDRSEAELDNLEVVAEEPLHELLRNEGEHDSDEEQDGEGLTLEARRARQREEEMRAEIEAEERERIEAEEREREEHESK